jgi:hypothetical protein
MVGWLKEEKGVPEELGEAILFAWVGALRQAVLTRAEREPAFFEALGKGEGTLALSAGLAPEGWRNEHLWAQIALQTGLPAATARELLEVVSSRLRNVDDQGVFEPLGQIRFPGRGPGQDGVIVRLRQDFLQPDLDEPQELIQGIMDTDEGEPSIHITGVEPSELGPEGYRVVVPLGGTPVTVTATYTLPAGMSITGHLTDIDTLKDREIQGAVGSEGIWTYQFTLLEPGHTFQFAAEIVQGDPAVQPEQVEVNHTQFIVTMTPGRPLPPPPLG